MIYSKITAFLLILFATLILSPISTDGDGLFKYKSSNDGNTDWCYKKPACGESAWPEKCQAGKEQSPIDIPSLESMDYDSFIEHFPKELYTVKGFTMVNNGYTIEVIPSSVQMPTFNWAAQGGHYKFNSMNFHWGSTDTTGSEHTVGGQSYAMELHLVHYRSEFESMDDALQSSTRNAIAVLTIFFQVSDGISKSLLKPIVQKLKEMREVGSQVFSKDTIDGHKLFQGSLAYSYYGSLSIPPCSEQVVYLIWDTPVNVTAGEVEAFRTLKSRSGEPLKDNFRSPRPRNDRDVAVVGVHYSLANKISGATAHKDKEA